MTIVGGFKAGVKKQQQQEMYARDVYMLLNMPNLMI